MPDMLSLSNLYADICVTYATLSVSFFILSRSEPFNFKGAYGKRILFGMVAGITGLYLRQNPLVVSDVISYSFATLPVIAVTFFGGWLSGVCSYFVLFFLSGMLTPDNVLMGFILSMLILFRVWHRRKHRDLYFTIIVAGILRQALVFYLYGVNPFWMTLLFYQAISACCMILCYHALNYKEIYINKAHLTRVQSATDELTQMNNRASIDYWLTQRQARRKTCGLILIDIDNFKQVNDTLGHLAGDLVLMEMGRLLRDLTRDVDFAGRYGGEEFLVMTSVYKANELLSVAERIRHTIESSTIVLDNGEKQKFTVSIGVSLYLPGMNIRNSLKLADLALYDAKRQGKNRVMGSVILSWAGLGEKRQRYSRM